MNQKTVRTFLITASFFASLAFSGQALASSCKGLESSACGNSASCTWVDGYTRKDGRKVSSFCRAKPSPKKQTKAAKSN